MAALTTYLAIGGLTLDLVGAAFLAYDALYGPDARFQAAIRRDRLAITRASQERNQHSLRELSGSASAPGEKEQLLKESVALDATVKELIAQLRHWEKHEHRALRNALLGLLLLMAGFAFQGISTVLSVS